MWPKSHVKVFNGPTTKKDLVDKGVDKLKDKNRSMKNSQNTIIKSKRGGVVGILRDPYKIPITTRNTLR